MKAASAVTLKETNRHNVTEFLYRHDNVTKQMLERELGLSLPTITANLRALEQDGLIGRGTPQESTGGRKAQTYVFNAAARASIGIGLRSSELTMVAVDLRGNVLERRQRAMAYRNADVYYSRVGALVTAFANDIAAKGSQVLGAAFAVQGIVAADGSRITFGQIADNTGLTLEQLSQGIDLPTVMIHDSGASAMAELWFAPEIRDAVCVYLNRRPGGAVIVNGELYRGPSLCNGTIEHMTLEPGGRECYCGQLGCMDTVCSPEVLAEDGESLPGFFSVLEQGERGHRRRFNLWLDHVAQAIGNIRTVLASDIVLGGEATTYLDDDELAMIKTRVEALSPFSEADFELRRSICADDQDIIGAALRFVEPFVTEVCGR